MKRAIYLEKLATYEKILAMQSEKGSTGSIGKLFDVVARDYIMKKGISRENDIRCRKNNQTDVINKKYGKFELKTGSGAVCYGEGLTSNDCIAENICAGVTYVVWAPFSKFLTKDNFQEMSWVFTREQFIYTLEKIGKKGLKSSLKVSKNGAQLNIQTITPRMEDRLWDILETMPTLEDFMGRA